MPTDDNARDEDEEDRPAPTSEADEFARAMSDVTPLRPDTRGYVRGAPPQARPPARDAQREREEEAPELRDDSFGAPGVDRREIRKLRRGDYPPGARLDLHGEKAVGAIARLEQFLADSRHRRVRCVCIVHGRGLHSQTGTSVLKSVVRGHLRASHHVLAWTDAPPDDGGPGAVYVLLRR